MSDPYASRDLRRRLSQRRFPAGGMAPEHAYQLIDDELALDGVARLNLATFCTTWVEEPVHRLMDAAMNKNIVDKDEYPATAQMEQACLSMLADLWHAPDPAHPAGTSTTGSSEAAMLCGLAAARRWRARRRAAGQATDTPNFVSGPVQVCWEKFGRYFDVEHRLVPMTADAFSMDPERAVAACDEHTVMVVVTLGQTFTGLYEDVAGVAAALDAAGLDVPIHVDAASGGFLAPFCAPALEWDFRLERVRSINASGHKMGLAPLGCGWALWHDPSDVPEELVFDVNYLGGHEPTLTLNFSRSGAPVIAQLYELLRLGRSGYTAVQDACYAVARHIAQGVERAGPFTLVFDGDPARGTTVVTWRLADGERSFTLFDLADRMRARGWLVPAYTLPPDREDLAVQRVVVRHGLSLDMADAFLADLGRALEQLGHHPPATSLTEAEAGGFSHDAVPRTAAAP